MRLSIRRTVITLAALTLAAVAACANPTAPVQQGCGVTIGSSC